MTSPDHPRYRLADEAPVARAAVATAVASVLFGFCFLPQLLALALGGISLVREPRARRHATLAVVLALVLTVAWGIAIGALLKWWAASR